MFSYRDPTKRTQELPSLLDPDYAKIIRALKSLEIIWAEEMREEGQKTDCLTNYLKNLDRGILIKFTLGSERWNIFLEAAAEDMPELALRVLGEIESSGHEDRDRIALMQGIFMSYLKHHQFYQLIHVQTMMEYIPPELIHRAFSHPTDHRLTSVFGLEDRKPCRSEPKKKSFIEDILQDPSYKYRWENLLECLSVTSLEKIFLQQDGRNIPCLLEAIVQSNPAQANQITDFIVQAQEKALILASNRVQHLQDIQRRELLEERAKFLPSRQKPILSKEEEHKPLRASLLRFPLRKKPGPL